MIQLNQTRHPGRIDIDMVVIVRFSRLISCHKREGISTPLPAIVACPPISFASSRLQAGAQATAGGRIGLPRVI